MSQSQQPHDMYVDYVPPANRSPTSSRPVYGAGGVNGFQSGLSLPRQSQRPFDSPLGSSALYPADRLAGGYNLRGLDQMSQASLAQGGYMLENQQAWQYNAASVATINGAMNGANRQRGVNRRTALPTTWTDPNSMPMHAPHQTFSPAGLAGSMPLSNGFRHDHGVSNGLSDFRMNGQAGEDQLIPTAIVIKNIPFAVRKETLAAMMLDMHLPVPYAFNYHFDGGVFRGLAFANFQSPEDTRIVIDAMNGMEVHGRKLRVEYKKMLPADERERIEREKRERRGQLEEQHRGPMLSHQPSIQSLNSTGRGHSTNPPLREIDLNDPQTLDFFTELMLFSKDASREIFIFPSTITPEQRRQIHILAHQMGLHHRSVGEADSRQIHVLKSQAASPTAQTQNHPSVSLDLHKRGLSRAATFDFAADRESRNPAANYSNALGRHGPMLELPGSPDGSGIPNNLRAAKSFADLRTLTPSPSHSASGYLNPANGVSSLTATTGATARFGDYGGFAQQTSGTPNLTPSTSGQGNDASLLAGSLGALSLGSFEPVGPPTQARNGPGAIGSQRPGAGGSGSRNAPERQPRGPEWEPAAGGFTGRRANGHVQRGSDSSDNASRATNPNSTRFQ